MDKEEVERQWKTHPFDQKRQMTTKEVDEVLKNREQGVKGEKH